MPHALLALLPLIAFAQEESPPGPRLIRTFGSDMLRHGGGVKGVDFSPDGSVLASCGRDGMVILWNPYTGGQLGRFDGHRGGMKGVFFGRDGRSVVSLGDDGTLLVRDTSNGEIIRRYPDHPREIQHATLAPDGRTIALAGHRGAVWFRDLETGEAGASLQAFLEARVSALAFSPRARILATGTPADPVVKIWDVDTGEAILLLTCHGKDGVSALAFSADGQRLATASINGEIIAWETDGTELQRCDLLQGPIQALAFSPDGRTIASAHEGRVCLTDIATGDVKEVPFRGRLDCVTYHPDGEALVVGSSRGDVGILDLEQGRWCFTHEDWPGRVSMILPSPDDRFVATVSDIARGRIWDLETGASRQISTGHLRSLPSFSPDGTRVACTSRVWEQVIEDVATGSRIATHDWPGWLLGYAAPGALVIAGDAGIEIRDEITGAVIRRIDRPTDPMERWALAPDGRRLVATLRDTAAVWDLVTGEKVRSIRNPGWLTQEAALSPDGEILVTVGKPDSPLVRKDLFLWEVSTGEPWLKLDLPADGIAFSADGRSLALAFGGGTPRILDACTGEEILGLPEPWGGNGIAFLPGDDRIIASGADGRAYLWDIGDALRRPEVIADDMASPWGALADPSPEWARPAMAAYIRSGRAAVEDLRARLVPLEVVPDEIRKLAKDLESEDLRVREGARVKLGRLGPEAEGALLAILDGSTDGEVRAGLSALVAANPRHPHLRSHEDLRWGRAIRILEAIGTSDAQEVLARVSETAPVARLRTRALLSLARLRHEALPIEAARPWTETRPPHLRLRPRMTLKSATLTIDSSRADSVDFSPDGRWVLAGVRGQGALLWDLDTELREIIWDSGEEGRNLAAFTPDGTHIVAASPTRLVVLSTPDGEILGEKTFTKRENPMGFKALAVATDGEAFATIGDRTSIWSIPDLAPTLEIPQQGYGVAFSPDGRVLATGNGVDTSLWDLATGEPICRLAEGGMAQPRSVYDTVAFSPDGWTVTSGSMTGGVPVWEVATGEEVLELQGHRHLVQAVAFSPDGAMLASGSYDGRIQVWDSRTGIEIAAFVEARQGNPVAGLAFSPDGSTLAVAGREKEITLHEIRPARLYGHKTPVSAVACSPDGSRIASGSWDGEIRIWETATSMLVRRLTGHNGWVQAIAFSPDGRHIASGSADGALFVQEFGTARKIVDVMADPEGLRAIAYSPDGSQIATGGWGGEVRTWDASTGEEIRSLGRHPGGVISLAFSPDGKEILTGGWDGKAQVLRGKDSRVVISPTKEPGPVIAVGYGARPLLISSDGANAASISLDGQEVALCDPNGDLRLQVSGKGATAPHGVGPITFAFAPDGSYGVSGGIDGTLIIWELSHHRRTSASPDDIETWRADLSGDEHRRALEAMDSLVEAGDLAIPALESLLLPPPPDTEEVHRLIALLDDEAYPVREEATQKLRALSIAAEAELRAALEGTVSAEAKVRLQGLLSALGSPTQDPGPVLARLRALVILERIGSQAATEALTRITAESGSPRERRLAEAALCRMR